MRQSDEPDTLVLDLRNVQVAEPGRLTFTVFISFDARVEYTRQRWEAGVKLFDASARARFRIKLTLDGEATARLDSSALILPDAVFRLRITRSQLKYDNFVLEHIAGVGGEAAKLFGQAAQHNSTRGRHRFDAHTDVQNHAHDQTVEQNFKWMFVKAGDDFKALRAMVNLMNPPPKER